MDETSRKTDKTRSEFMYRLAEKEEEEESW